MKGGGVVSEPKPFASLSSSLLARKGQARPAMRPQGFAGFGPMTGNPEDLGWNDMGLEPAAPVAAGPVPQVVRQRTELAEELAARSTPEAPPETVAVLEPAAMPRRPKKKMAISHGAEPAVVRIKGKGINPHKKAAFTLRLDAERHLRLRLACAVNNRSAQQLVTEAVDRLLDSIPELDELAGRVPARRVS